MLWALIDIPRFPDRGWEVLDRVARHVTAILLRDKGRPDDQLYEMGRRIRQRSGEIPLWIDGSLEVACALGAYGLHLPAGAAPAAWYRKHWAGPLSAAVHHPEEFSHHRDADVFIWGHAFETRSKPGFPPRAKDSLFQILPQTHQPVLAIGGINKDNIAQVMTWGVAGAVVSDGIWSDPDPVDAARCLSARVKHREAGAWS